MKLIPIALLVFAAGGLAYIAATARTPTYIAPTTRIPTRLEGAIPAGHIVRSFEVDGMCCTSCTAKLHRALLSVDGVKEAAVSFDERFASAVVPASLPIAELRQALEFDKYTARVKE